MIILLAVSLFGTAASAAGKTVRSKSCVERKPAKCEYKMKKEQKKTIWFINQNSYLPEDGPHIRHYALGKYLARDGYEPFVFAGNELHHNGRRIDTGRKLYIEKNRDGVHFFYIKTHHYIKNDAHRILNILSFYRNVFKVCRQVEREYGKPDVIYASSMYPTALLAGIKLAKKYNVKCISENRDIVPDGFVANGAIKENGFLVKAMRLFMRRIYEKSDALVFTMSEGPKYISDMKWDKLHGGKIDMTKVFYINNGVDMEAKAENEKRYVLEDPDLDDPDTFKVVYFGAIRFMNQMPLFIETASELKKRGYNNIRILMWGNGTKLDEMRRKLNEKKLDNIILKGYVDKQFIPGIAKRADIFIGTGNSCSVGKYGMSFNKLFDYLAAGKPIILPFRVAGSIVAQNGAGLEIDNADAKTLADAIISFMEMPREKYNEYCENARRVGQQFDYAIIAQQVNDAIDQVLE